METEAMTTERDKALLDAEYLDAAYERYERKIMADPYLKKIAEDYEAEPYHINDIVKMLDEWSKGVGERTYILSYFHDNDILVEPQSYVKSSFEIKAEEEDDPDNIFERYADGRRDNKFSFIEYTIRQLSHFNGDKNMRAFIRYMAITYDLHRDLFNATGPEIELCKQRFKEAKEIAMSNKPLI